jgi:hypothetical protein
MMLNFENVKYQLRQEEDLGCVEIMRWKRFENVEDHLKKADDYGSVSSTGGRGLKMWRII